MTLTELSYYSRKAAPFVGLFFLFIIILFYIIKFFFIYLGSQQPKSIYSNPIFGSIKKPYLKEASPSSNLQLTLDTVEGRPVTATQAANVYFIPPITARFGYREKIYLMAKTLDFNTEFIKHKLNDKIAIFKDLKQNLEIDIANFNFSYKYDFVNDPDLFLNTVSPTKSDSLERATSLLKSVGRYPNELSQGKTNIILYFYNPADKTYKIVEKEIDANMVEVNFYRPDQEQYPIISPSYFNSQNHVLLVFNKAGFKVVKAQVRFFEKSETQIGTYIIKSGDSAWEELKNGKGFIVSNPEGLSKVAIKKMFLGYLDPDIYQQYLQPIYIFLGGKNFVGYVPAVTDSYSIE